MENFDILEVLKKTLETKGIQYSENYSGSLNFTNWHNLSYLEKQEEIEYQYFEPGENFIIYSKSANGLVCELSVQGNFTIDYVIRMYKEKKNFKKNEEFMFLYCGKLCDKSKTLNDYCISKETMVFFVPILRGGCFIENTFITMSDLSKTLIQDLKIGDHVLSYDIESYRLVSKQITQTFKKKSDEIIEIEFSNAKIITCTTSHPFYTKNKGWVSFTKNRLFPSNISKLEVGDELMLQDLLPLYIKSIKRKISPLIDVFNFEVEDTHCYFAEGVLVHNNSDEVFDKYHVSKEIFDSSFHFDFRHIDDKGKCFTRGSLKYYRPCGSERYALKVLGKYENDNWMTSNKSWVNAYHGTGPFCIEKIVDQGLKIGGKDGCVKKNGAVYGEGVYVTPFPEVAQDYSPVVSINGKKYKIIFQCRVEPNSYSQHHPITGRHNKLGYWVIKDDKKVRPYSICVYKLKD